MADKSRNAEIRELQTDIKYIRRTVDEVRELQRYTNGKVAKAVSDIENIRSQAEQYVTKSDLQESEKKVELRLLQSDAGSWVQVKWIVITAVLGAIVGGIVSFIVPF